ncbi:hypothetical protein Ddc_16159 [Ditylenchus destructor]|nr:hypothetical protein Ddc_16159 [Ditylenchus destructor]
MLPSSREDDWYRNWAGIIFFSGVMSHRKVENPGFSHGHNWLCATVFQACDTSFCSSHRAEHTGQDFPTVTTGSAQLCSRRVIPHFAALIELSILAKFQPEQSCAERVVSHRKVENPGFSHGHNWLCATVFQACDTSFCSSHRAEHTGQDFPTVTTGSAQLCSRRVIPHFAALIELSILAKFQPEQSCAERVVSHRKVENPGFSHGHSCELSATVFHACDSSFCSSERAEQTGKVSASKKPGVQSYESPQSRESRFSGFSLAHSTPPNRAKGATHS